MDKEENRINHLFDTEFQINPNIPATLEQRFYIGMTSFLKTSLSSSYNLNLYFITQVQATDSEYNDPKTPCSVKMVTYSNLNVSLPDTGPYKRL